MAQIDVTVTVEVEEQLSLKGLSEAVGESVVAITGGKVVDGHAHLVSDLIAAHKWSNTLAREFAWLIADREEDNAAEVVAWVHEHEDDAAAWDEVSRLADSLSYRATTDY